MNESLFHDLTTKNGVAFWKKWNSIDKAGNLLSSRVNGETDEQNIANEFASYFESVYSGSEDEVYSTLKQKFITDFASYYANHINDTISPYYVTWSEMLDVAAKIKIGKASAGILRPEHFLFGAPELLRHLQHLFNGMIQHSFVPTEFVNGTITPIVKDSQGDVSSPSNYRGITLSCLPEKLFEFIIQKKTSHLLGTDELQFGFKSRTSTSHAINTLKTTIDYFNQRGSSVYVAFLDCSKAFDRISHYGLFSKLIERRIPLCILMCLIFWYANMTCCVKWGNDKSRRFEIPLGIKQGGINSPDFFSCYFDGLVQLLRKSQIGCHMYKLYLGIILFADDICLLAPTRSALQSLINMSASYCHKQGLNFNPRKSKVLVFSKKKIDFSILSPILLNGDVVQFSPAITYLGVLIESDRGFCVSATNDLRSFYRAANSVLSALHKPSEEVLMQLLYTNCVPIITYACGVKSYSARDMRDCNTAINNSIRKIFTFHRWESVRSLRESLGFQSVYDIFARTTENFHKSMAVQQNSVLRQIYLNNC